METHPSPYGCPWELVICTAIGFFVVLLFLWRSYQSVRIGKNVKYLKKLNLFKKSLSKIKDEILFLVKELKEEKTKNSQQDELMADISKNIKSLEDESKSLRSQIPKAKTTLRIFQMNEEGVTVAIKEAFNENSQLQESQKQLLEDIEVWKEKLNSLNKQKMALVHSKVHAEHVLRDKENHIKSLTEHLLQIKNWAPVLGEVLIDEGNLELEMKSESEIGAHLENQPKGALKKLVYVAKLKASFKTIERESTQFFTLLSEVGKPKEELTEHIKNLKTEQASLQAENTQFVNENKNLKQKLKVMMKLYQENVMELQRKLIGEENYQVEQEEKFSKVEEKITKYLEEELERTIHFYQGHVMCYEKKAHGNELAAHNAERYLNDLRKQNAHHRQKLTKMEFKFKLVEKDHSALDVSNTAFGRGSRGSENPLDHPSSNKKRESNCDRLTDPQRAPSDTISLAPPREQAHRTIIPPPGQPYSDPQIPLPRQDGFYFNSGKLSGPVEHRSSTMPSLDKMDGPTSSEMESSNHMESRNYIKVNLLPDSSLPAENQATGSAFAFSPFPPIRGSLFPVDPRSQFMRRGTFFFLQLLQETCMEHLENIFHLAHHPLHSQWYRGVFLIISPQELDFFPHLPPPHSESRSEFPSGLI
uniref:Uncharacterized protein n=1 Tax=Spermophilus dauricus TaxID=99837 RepID=A0A8C9PN72_SPEDA